MQTFAMWKKFSLSSKNNQEDTTKDDKKKKQWYDNIKKNSYALWAGALWRGKV